MIESTLHRYIKRVQNYISEAELEKLDSDNSKKATRQQVMANGTTENGVKISHKYQPLNGAFVTGNLDHVEEL
ncbi:hypothetical protein D3C86_2235430 [compost metagenome]